MESYVFDDFDKMRVYTDKLIDEAYELGQKANDILQDKNETQWKEKASQCFRKYRELVINRDKLVDDFWCDLNDVLTDIIPALLRLGNLCLDKMENKG